MDVVRFPAGFAELASEIRTHLLPGCSKRQKHAFGDHTATVLGYEDQVGLKAVDNVSSGAKVPCACHRPSYALTRAGPVGDAEPSAGPKRQPPKGSSELQPAALAALRYSLDMQLLATSHAWDKQACSLPARASETRNIVSRHP